MADNIAYASKKFRRKEVRFQEDLNSFVGKPAVEGWNHERRTHPHPQANRPRSVRARVERQ